MARRKRSELDEKVYDLWDALLSSRPQVDSIKEYRNFLVEQASDWQRLLDTAYVGGKWLTGYGVAVTVSGTRWYNFMALQDYANALRETERLSEHPAAEIADSFDCMDAALRMEVARMALGECTETPKRLFKKLSEGPETPQRIAGCLRADLAAWLHAADPDTVVSSELVCLVGEVDRILHRRRKATIPLELKTLGELDRWLNDNW